MEILFATTKKHKKAIKKFRRDLYKNDLNYVSTAEFTFDMLLNKETAFARSIDISPVMCVSDNKIIITSLLIYNPADDFLQVSFFEALDNIGDEVDEFIDFVRGVAKERQLNRIIIGLNGHLSYGVGLSVDMNCANTFDSTYTKTYYIKYFEKYKKHELVAFSNKISVASQSLFSKNSGITIRKIDLNDFDNEMEKFRNICDETIGKTFLYTQTDKKHFYDLLNDMTFFLKSENILFAEDNGTVVGFLFWHPDYNEILKKGKQNSLLTIAARYTLLKNRITKVKLNSIGVKDAYQGVVTIKLIYEMEKYVRKYDTIETNFVWVNNKKSMAINKKLLQNVERHFAVYEVNV